MKEWSDAKKWNPFNSYKLLAQVYRWRLIKRGHPIPQPALVTVDPINSCNLSCQWCNASYILSRRHGRISDSTLNELASFLSTWQGSPAWPSGVEAICIAGGGEPLLHPKLDAFIEKCISLGIEVGVVTNGTLIHEHLEALSLCTWVGVSVDAGRASTFQKLKGKDLFGKVCDNISLLGDYITRHPQSPLANTQPGYGISYKFLLYSGNIEEIYDAASLAKQLGCKNFHLRPAGISWDKIKTGNKSIFEKDIRLKLEQQIDNARTLEDNAFGVYGITHKFDAKMNKANHFSYCHAIFMTSVFMPPRSENEKLCMGLCCDRRGDSTLECPSAIDNLDEISRFWGSDEHWKIFDNIKLSECPRCTYQPHNQIYEHVIQNDSMTYKFI